MANDASRRGPSLKARAVAYLSRREHSRLELQRKLSAYSDDPAEIESVLDDLQRSHWQSDQRYAQAYAHRTAGRQGAQRILGTLRQQGVADDQLDGLQHSLRETEPERALAVWQRKFSAPPRDARDYARQYRFLAGRGFSSDAIRRVLSDRDRADDPGDQESSDDVSD
ncbi:recombination regulator RecX [Castellaniella sp.]|uniref:recombination regulator RecX n=1 Tax=Castellaniella sp. TaxID=1955812 RepID=UPI002AFE1F76|nr:recombination regulator RecX [Castellaniella sp.]